MGPDPPEGKKKKKIGTLQEWREQQKEQKSSVDLVTIRNRQEATA